MHFAAFYASPGISSSTDRTQIGTGILPQYAEHMQHQWLKRVGQRIGHPRVHNRREIAHPSADLCST